MKKLIKEAIKGTPINDFLIKKRQKKELLEWNPNCKISSVSHLIKPKNLKEHALKHNLKTLVENQTYLGDTVEAMKSDFDKIYTIKLYEDACHILRKENNVSFYTENDSTRITPA